MSPTPRPLPVAGACALLTLTLAACGEGWHPCIEKVSNLVTSVEAASDPCAGKSTTHVVAWFSRRGIRYPLRCGQTDPRGYGYVHILRDRRDGYHLGGDAANDSAFAAEIAYTLDHGVERVGGSGTRTYTVEYSQDKKACTDAWGFRVTLLPQPQLSDGHPLGITEAFGYSSEPADYP